MEFINSTDKRLIEDFWSGKITKEDFVKQTNFKADYETLIYLIDSSKKYWNRSNGNNRAFSEIFWRLPEILSQDEEVKIYRKYLLVEWHHEHEEIAGSFQMFYNKDKENIPILLQAITVIPEYLRSVDPYPYVRKLIYAIGAQPEPYNIEALGKLVDNTTDEEIKALALHQIEKRKKYGRWEAKENER